MDVKELENRYRIHKVKRIFKLSVHSENKAAADHSAAVLCTVLLLFFAPEQLVKTDREQIGEREQQR